MPRELALDASRVADEQQPDLQVPRGDERAVDDGGRRVVAAHGVDRDAHACCKLPALGSQLASNRCEQSLTAPEFCTDS